VRGKVGQPSVPLSLNPDGAYSVGVQVGRRNLELLVADFCGQPVDRFEVRYDYPDPSQLFGQITEGLHTLQARRGDGWSRVVGLGLTAPLSLHKWGDVLGGPAAEALAAWERIDLAAEVQALTELPVVFAKDTIAACVAELLQGRGRELRSFLYVFVSTFVGGGLVLQGHIMGGERGNAGAIGSLPVGLASAAGAPPQLLQMASGWQLEQALAATEPDLVFIMGRLGAQALLETDEPLGRLRGQVHELWGLPAIVSYDPPTLLRSPGDKGKAWDDLCLALQLAREQYEERRASQDG
jgi:predicted NBD/HSP70 family sugar kinase